MNEKRMLGWIDENDSRYNPYAYWFVLEALRYTQCHFNKPRHVSGQELLVGITQLARNKFGDLALDVIEEWGIRSSRDVGNIVFNLVKMGEIKKTDEDRLEDFDAGLDLQKELGQLEYTS